MATRVHSRCMNGMSCGQNNCMIKYELLIHFRASEQNVQNNIFNIVACEHLVHNDFINIYRIKITRTTSWTMYIKMRNKRCFFSIHSYKINGIRKMKILWIMAEIWWEHWAIRRLDLSWIVLILNSWMMNCFSKKNKV